MVVTCLVVPGYRQVMIHSFPGSFFRSVAHFGVSRGNDIDDKDKCLSSLDGRPYTQVGGYKAEDKQTAKNGVVWGCPNLLWSNSVVKKPTWSQGDLVQFDLVGAALG